MGKFGIPNRNGGGILKPSGRRYPASYYPVSNTISADKWPRYPGSEVGLLGERSEIVVNQIDYLDGKARGFAYCYADPGFVIRGELAEKLTHETHLIVRVDDQAVAGGARNWRNTGVNLVSFFERDEFFFTSFEFWIDSVRGGV